MQRYVLPNFTSYCQLIQWVMTQVYLIGLIESPDNIEHVVKLACSADTDANYSAILCREMDLLYPVDPIPTRVNTVIVSAAIGKLGEKVVGVSFGTSIDCSIDARLLSVPP